MPSGFVPGRPLARKTTARKTTAVEVSQVRWPDMTERNWGANLHNDYGVRPYQIHRLGSRGGDGDGMPVAAAAAPSSAHRLSP